MNVAPTGYVDAITRIAQIQDQLTGLQGAFTPATAGTTASGASSTPQGSVAAGSMLGSGGSGSFSSQLAGAMSSAGSSTTAGAATPSALTSLTTPGALSGATATTGTADATLPASATGRLTSDQAQFASRLASDTGLDPGVVSAWLLAEESGGAAVSRQAAQNNDWLNIGYTDSATYGSGDSIWSDPVSAADATAGWLKGQNTIPGYGTASSGIQAVLGTAGQPPATQIAALQHSGWASSGYPDLPALYAQLAG